MVLVKSVEVDIGVKGDTESKAKLDAISKRAEDLKKAFPEYKLKIDSAAASERLAVFRRQVKATADAVTRPMDPVVLTGKAKAKLLEIKVAADELKRNFPEFTARIDTTAAKRKLAVLAAEAAATQAAIDSGFGGAGSGGRGGILSRAGGLIGGGGGGGGAAGGGGLLTSPGGLAAIGGGAAFAAALTPAVAGLGIGGLAGGGAVAGGMFGAAEGKKTLDADLANIKVITAKLKTAVGQQQKELSAALKEAQAKYSKDAAFFAPFTAFQSSLQGLGRTLLAPLRSVMAPLAQIFTGFGKGLTALGPQMTAMFSASLPFVRMFLALMLQAGKILMPAFTQAMTAMVKSGALQQMSQGLVILVRGLAGFITALGPGMKSSAMIFTDFMVIAGAALRATGLAFAYMANEFESNMHSIRLTIHHIAASFADFRHRTAVIFDGIRGDIHHYWDMAWNNTIGRAQRGVGDIKGILSGAWRWISQVFGTNIVGFFTRTLPGAFAAAVSAIGRFWGGLKNTVRAPVAWVVDNVIDGLIRVFDTITSAVGLGRPIAEVHPFGLAAGGRIPGFGGGDRWPALLEGGEAVVDKQTTAAHAAELRAWGVPGFDKGGRVGQNPPAVNLHTGVGTATPTGAPGFIGKIVDAGKMALAFATGNSKAFSNAFAALLGIGTGGAGGIMSRILTQVPKVIAGDLVKWIMGKSAAQGNGGSIANYAMTFLGKIPYVWGGTAVPGGADCSGFTQAIYRHFGIMAPRTSEAQGAWVHRSGPVPGGLAFYDSPAGGPPPGHVAIVRSALQVISQGGGMGPTLMPIHAMPLLWTGVPPGGLRTGGGGGATGGTMSPGAIAALWTALGGPGFAAANMASIAMAESGDRPGAVQQGQPPGLTGWGLYQITPTSGISQNGAFGNLLNAANNTRAAISLFSQSGYGPWSSDPVGRQLAAAPFGFDTGYGVLPPGLSLSWNGTGRPEMLQPAGRGGGRGGGVTYIINVHVSPLARPADTGREVVSAIRAYEKGSGKGWRS